jgi:hypothetical protein
MIENVVRQDEIETLESLQVITRKIDPTKIDHLYINKLRREIKTKIESGKDLTIIYFIPTAPIEKRWVVWSLLDLQKEFTEILVMPKNIFTEDELKDYFFHFDPVKVYST